MEKEKYMQEVLLSIYRVDVLENKFHNKIKFMNLAHLVANLERMDEDKLGTISENLKKVLAELNQVNNTIENLEQPVLDLIQSY